MGSGANQGLSRIVNRATPLYSLCPIQVRSSFLQKGDHNESTGKQTNERICDMAGGLLDFNPVCSLLGGPVAYCDSTCTEKRIYRATGKKGGIIWKIGFIAYIVYPRESRRTSRRKIRLIFLCREMLAGNCRTDGMGNPLRRPGSRRIRVPSR